MATINMAETCRLCLNSNLGQAVVNHEDDQLRRKIDKVFYFQVFRNRDIPSMVCDICIETVDGFYEYAEKVMKNQQFLRSALVPVPSTSTAAALSELGSHVSNDMVKIEYSVKREPTETEWVGVDTYCETSVVSVQDELLQKDIHLEELDLDTKDDQEEWLPVDEDEEYESDVSEISDLDIKDDDEYEEEEGEYIPKAKRKYTPRKKSTSPKKPKAPSKPREPRVGPSLDEKILQHYKLSCDLCAEPLEDFTVLRKHYKNCHDQEGYLKCCNKKIYKKCWMIEHIQLHLDPDAFHCDICNKSYSSSKVLKEHTKEVHSPNEDRPFKCEVCLKPFVSNAHLNAHTMVAHGSVQCPQCPKVLASQGSLKKHLVAMHGDGEQHVCDVCARVFRSKQCFDTHVKGHLGTRLENKVQCNVCSVWLTDKYCLTKHIRRMHVQPDVAMACELCGKQVRNQDALNCHMRRAHTESRFECDICHKKFKRPHHMREHIAIHHTGEDLYGCNHCSERFNTKNKQYMHRKTAHPLEWEEEMRKRIMKDP
ncbi:transcription factor grauzone-like [Uranotaenia lowii]|uniref:transcription factor grauzone-like n=1 Tax=Uranotaenia lowii TaxID=190385 RepID=UPI0024797553|nr:transcription factor grauzone-like [Uranotaenia lowii]XP_055609364.1 transcription factor grauzone-like [Uranotaenia lowii]